MAGSCVWKPGERHAKPTSCIAKPAESRDVKGADGLPVDGPRPLVVLEVRSSRFGRGLADCIVGDPGSFFTLIMGGAPFRALCISQSVFRPSLLYARKPQTYELGDTFPLDVVRSKLTDCSAEPGEPLLLTRLGAGSTPVGTEVILLEGASDRSGAN